MAKAKTKMDYAVRIFEARRALGISQAELRDRMMNLGYKIHPQQVSRWELGKAVPTGENTVGLENALDQKPGWLWHGEQAAGRTSLPNSELINLVKELQISDEEQALLSSHLASREAAHDVVNKNYVMGYIRGMREFRVPQAAHDAAVAARVTSEREGEERRIVRKGKK